MIGRPIFVGASLVVAAACGPKGPDGGASADSTSTTAGMITVTGDSLAPGADSTRPDTTRRDPTRPTTQDTTRASSSTTGTPVVGRDSAFGPKFLVDSTGKLIPIPTKKP